MRAWFLLGSATLLLLPLASAGEGAVTKEGDVDYQITGLLQGSVAATPLAVLAALETGTEAPQVALFQLAAERIEATFVEHSSDTQVGILSAAIPATGRAGQDGAASTTVIKSRSETRTYESVELQLAETSPLWNFVATATGNPEAAFDLQLPTGDFELANAPLDERIVREDVPLTSDVSNELATAFEAARGQLKIRSDALTASVSGEFYLLLYGGTFDLRSPEANERIFTGRHEEADSFQGTPIPGKRTVNETVLLHVIGGSLAISQGGQSVAAYAPEFHVMGRAEFPDSSGSFGSPGSEGESLLIEGDFFVTSRGAPYLNEAGDPYGPIHVRGQFAAPSGPALMTGGVAWAVAATGAAAGAAALRWIPGPRRLAFAAIAGFSMVGRDDALDHKSRQQIHDYVRANPGASLSTLQRDLSLGWGTVEYHVAVLERLRLLVTKRVGAKRLLFCNGHSRLADPAVWSLLQNPSVKTLSDALEGGVGLSQQEVAGRLGCSSQYAGRLLRRLAELGLIQSESAGGRRRLFRATPLLVDLERKIASAAQSPTPVGPETPEVPVVAVPAA